MLNSSWVAMCQKLGKTVVLPETMRFLLGNLSLHQEDNASGSSISIAVDNTLLQLKTSDQEHKEPRTNLTNRNKTNVASAGRASV